MGEEHLPSSSSTRRRPGGAERPIREEAGDAEPPARTSQATDPGCSVTAKGADGPDRRPRCCGIVASWSGRTGAAAIGRLGSGGIISCSEHYRRNGAWRRRTTMRKKRREFATNAFVIWRECMGATATI
ncbi:hypothetical protein U1Q18_011815 [Sarracenia purpurea var. burkii]